MALIPRLFIGMVFLLSALGAAAFGILLPTQVFAHGSMESPVSRVLNCRLENPENPHSEACKAAVEALVAPSLSMTGTGSGGVRPTASTRPSFLTANYAVEGIRRFGGLICPERIGQLRLSNQTSTVMRSSSFARQLLMRRNIWNSM